MSAEVALVIVAIVCVPSIAAVWYFIHIWQEKKGLRTVLQYKLVHVALYRPLEQDKRDWKQEIALSEQLFTSLASFKLPPVMEIAVHNISEEIHFYFAVGRAEVDSLIRLIQAFWPRATVEPTQDYNIFNPTGGSIIAALKQTKEKILSIKTFDTTEEDSLLPILNIFSSLLKQGDGIAMQIIFKKAGSGAAKKMKKALEEMQKGESLKKALEKADSTPLKELGETFIKSFSVQQKPAEEKKQEKKETVDQETITLISKKLGKPLLDVNIRFVISCENEERANTFLNQLQSIYPLYTEVKGNGLELQPYSGKKELKSAYDYSFRYFRNDQKLVLNTQELASVAHLPTQTILSLSKVQQVKSRTAAPPIELPQEGLLLGTSVYRSERKPAYMLTEDRFRHMYVIGQTGTGKSTFLKNLMKQDIENNNGIAFIDPHGDDAENVLTFIPESRMQDVVYFNPADIEHPMAFNMLEYDRTKPQQRTFIANELIEIIGKIYDLKETGGPMFEQYLKNALFLLMLDPIISPTILDVQRVFSDTNFRQELLGRCPDPAVVMFWKKEAEKAGGDWSLSNMSIWVNSKLTPFISNDYIKPIIGQEKSTLDFKDILAHKKILVINLSKGKLGETNAFFLGLLIVGKILMYAMEREASERTDFYFYIDEFQNVVTKTISSILSEARKFRLALHIAHQYIAQIPEDVKNAVFGNVGTIVAFRIEIKDADAIKDYFKPNFDQQDLIRLDNMNAYIRPLIQGKTASAFNIFIDFPPRTDPQKVNKIQDLCRQKFTKPREQVIEAINAKYVSVKPPEPPTPAASTNPFAV